MMTKYRTAREAVGIERMTSVLVAGLLGAFVFLAVGFAPIEAVHNAAHDARHVFSFPCH